MDWHARVHNAHEAVPRLLHIYIPSASRMHAALLLHNSFPTQQSLWSAQQQQQDPDDLCAVARDLPIKAYGLWITGRNVCDQQYMHCTLTAGAWCFDMVRQMHCLCAGHPGSTLGSSAAGLNRVRLCRMYRVRHMSCQLLHDLVIQTCSFQWSACPGGGSCHTSLHLALLSCSRAAVLFSVLLATMVSVLPRTVAAVVSHWPLPHFSDLWFDLQHRID